MFGFEFPVTMRTGGGTAWLRWVRADPLDKTPRRVLGAGQRFPPAGRAWETRKLRLTGTEPSLRSRVTQNDADADPAPKF